MDPPKFVKKGNICESIHFDPLFWKHVHHNHVVECCMSVSYVSGIEYVSCLGTSKKLSLGV